MTVKEVLSSFIKSRGKPSQIVCSVVWKFAFRELLHGLEITLVTLPEHVWERNKVYMNNVMSSLVFFIAENQVMVQGDKLLVKGPDPIEPVEPPPPVDRSKRTLTDGSPVTPDHTELKPNGQQKGYVILSADERAKGFVRPVRRTYRHKVCGTTTTMGQSIAETYARDPGFYSGTFCVQCAKHFPLDQFVWEGTDEQVGS